MKCIQSNGNKSMITAVLAFGLGLSLIFGFQNCEEALGPENESLGNGGDPIEMKAGLLEDLIEVRWTDYSASNTRSLLLNPLDGTIRLESQQGGGRVYCVPSDLHQELLDLLEGERACSFPRQAGPEVSCTAILRLPYASLHFSDGESIELGVSYSGCGPSVDLCEESEAPLKDLLLEIRSTYETFSCQ